jgi:hypothetical protein
MGYSDVTEIFWDMRLLIFFKCWRNYLNEIPYIYAWVLYFIWSRALNDIVNRNGFVNMELLRLRRSWVWNNLEENHEFICYQKYFDFIEIYHDQIINYNYKYYCQIGYWLYDDKSAWWSHWSIQVYLIRIFV